ncbi:PREDICTED: uncharacterized protein At3g60930, chloroplastic-like [Camelina sativa]|uniref:Uncharacterized protein At3g60930, chloroplastic-like n=1 Tax=Camelina sativa TaxID=90675 RepID=A0ABM1QH76_CAMSA|nr:PREDICTED: uncharacterized protein At3g60930, chloroplastic-like [Camelina sativa]
MSPPKSSSGKAAKPLIPGVYGPHQSSNLSAENLAEVRGSTGIPPEVEIRFPEAHESSENPPPGYCCAFEIFFSTCGLSFPLPELIVNMMFELGFALPQMCANFVRTVMCLQTLGEEFDYQLSLADFLQVYTVKTGHTKGTLYVSPLSGLKVFDDLPEKDEKWRKSYFFFPVNELGHRTSSYVLKWTLKIDHFERRLLCPTFAEFFSRFCSQGQIAWDSFSCERIRASTARLGRRSLVCSDPVSVSEMNYREERACRIAEKEAKKQMAAALAEGKACIPIKNSSGSSVPEVSGTSAPPTGSSELGTESTKAPAGPLSMTEMICSKNPSAPPASPADLMRSYIRPGVLIPAFADMTEVNRFADKIGKLMIEFNSSVASYEDQLFASPSSSEVNLLQERIADLEAQKAEIEVLDLGVANEDLRDKLKKARDLYFEAAGDLKAAKNRLHEIELRNQLLEAGNSCEIERVRREERQAMKRTLRPLVEEVKVTFEEREKLAPLQIRAAEIRANRMLVEEISRREIQDMEAELGLLKADEEEADEKVSKVTPRDLDLTAFSDLLADMLDLLCSEHPLSVTIDESGTNVGQISNQGMDDYLANTRLEGELVEMGLALSETASEPAFPNQ